MGECQKLRRRHATNLRVPWKILGIPVFSHASVQTTWKNCTTRDQFAMKAGTTYFTAPNGERVVRSRTIVFPGGFLHIDRIMVPIARPSGLGGAEPPVEADSLPSTNKSRPNGANEDEKMPIADAGKT